MDRQSQRFETLILPWLDPGYNLARWLLRDEAAAEDALQDACLRALRHLDGLRSETEARPWFLRIVRNCSYSLLQLRSERIEQAGFSDSTLEGAMADWQQAQGEPGQDPARLLQANRQREAIDAALRALPPPLREVLVLRELEGLDYAEIAAVAELPMGTVMSRLSRGRARLRELLRTEAPSAPGKKELP